MPKRSQRFPVQYEKDQSGCMWGFISMFDFRHARFTRKLIADKRHNNKQALEAVPTKNKFEALSDLDEEYQGDFDRGESKRLTVKTDADKLSVKKLIEEEMFIDRDEVKDQSNNVGSKKTELGSRDSLKTDSKRKRKSRKKSRDMDTNDLTATLKSEFSDNQHLKQQSRDNLDLDKIMEDFCQIERACSLMHEDDDDDSKVNAQSNQKKTNSEELARDAIHDFVNQKILSGKDHVEDEKLLCSHELLETLQVISSDKELFLKLLQDPNSHLLKYMQELENARGRSEKEFNSIADSNFSEQDLRSLKQTREIVNRKHRKFFWKKVKSQSKVPTNKIAKTEVPNRIVILKPATTSMQISESENNIASSPDSRDIVPYKGPSSMRVGSHFSLTEIKRKLKHAIGKEKNGSREFPAEGEINGSRSKANGKDKNGMKSPNKDRFFIEKIARPMFDVVKGNKTSTLKDSKFNAERESGSKKEKVSNIYIEARKHLSEMLENGDDDTGVSSRHVPKTLGRILSLPEYNFSPLGSPGGNLEHHYATGIACTNFSTSDKIMEVNDDNLSPKQATSIDQTDRETSDSENCSSVSDENERSNEVPEIETKSTFSHDLGHVDNVEAIYPVRDDIVAEGNVELAKDINVLESSSDPNDCIDQKDQIHDASEIPDDARFSECLNADVKEENQPSSPLSSPSHSSITEKIEEIESTTDVSGRPSPVSVLDIPFSDDDPGYSTCQPVKLRVQPLQIRFEEQDTSSMDRFHRRKCCFEENELIYDYINAVSHASGLTQDQLLMKCLSSNKILDPSLFDQVEFFSNMLSHEQKLLFDSINEVFMEVCWHYFGISPCVSFVNPSIRPTPNMKKIILKVWEGVCWHVLPLPPPHTLEQIVRKDLARNGTWMELRLDAETVGFEMSDTILVELMEDAILSLVSESTES